MLGSAACAATDWHPTARRSRVTRSPRRVRVRRPMRGRTSETPETPGKGGRTLETPGKGGRTPEMRETDGRTPEMGDRTRETDGRTPETDDRTRETDGRTPDPTQSWVHTKLRPGQRRAAQQGSTRR